jgi:hypothetical protein
MSDLQNMHSVAAVKIVERTDAPTLLARLSADAGFRVEAPIDVDLIADLVGISLSEDDRDGTPLIGWIRLENNEPHVWLNPRENTFAPRRRFTLAHEIGHYCLHVAPAGGRQSFNDDAQTLNRDAAYWDRQEFEANNFAAELLMPIALINKHGSQIVSEHDANFPGKKLSVDSFVAKLAAALVVSRQAIKYRLENVGIL